MHREHVVVDTVFIVHYPSKEKSWIEFGAEYPVGIDDIVVLVNFLIEEGHIKVAEGKKIELVHPSQFDLR